MPVLTPMNCHFLYVILIDECIFVGFTLNELILSQYTSEDNFISQRIIIQAPTPSER